MARRNDIDPVLREWAYEPGEISARVVKATDGRQVVQMRIEMGLLQMELEGRPDGERPEGFPSLLDYLQNRAMLDGTEWVLDEDECLAVDREFVQYYHRRMCWLALRDFDRACADADHTLALMDLCSRHSPDEEWSLSHEQYRPFVLFHRTQAAALAKLEEHGPESAIEQIGLGLAAFRELFAEYEIEDQLDEDELVIRLEELQESIREHYDVGRTLPEQLHDAVNSEDYELAARLRDELARRGPGKQPARGRSEHRR